MNEFDIIIQQEDAMAKAFEEEHYLEIWDVDSDGILYMNPAFDEHVMCYADCEAPSLIRDMIEGGYEAATNFSYHNLYIDYADDPEFQNDEAYREQITEWYVYEDYDSWSPVDIRDQFDVFYVLVKNCACAFLSDEVDNRILEVWNPVQGDFGFSGILDHDELFWKHPRIDADHRFRGYYGDKPYRIGDSAAYEIFRRMSAYDSKRNFSVYDLY